MIEALFRTKYNGVGKRLVLQQAIKKGAGDMNYTLGQAYGLFDFPINDRIHTICYCVMLTTIWKMS